MSEPSRGKHRNTRSQNLLDDLEDTPEAPPPPSRAIPAWLVDSHLAHKRSVEENPGRPSGAAPTRSKDHAARKAAAAAAATASSTSSPPALDKQKAKGKGKGKNGAKKSPVNESSDFVVYDLLDAAHVASGSTEGDAPVPRTSKEERDRIGDAANPRFATSVDMTGVPESVCAALGAGGAASGAANSAANAGGTAANGRGVGTGNGGDIMSQATDSILSLPPMDDGVTRWHTLKAQAQEARSKSRCASFAGKLGSGSRLPPRAAGGFASGNQAAYASPPRRRREGSSHAIPAPVAGRSPLAAGAVPITSAAAAASGVSVHLPQPQPVQPAQAILRRQQTEEAAKEARAAGVEHASEASSSPANVRNAGVGGGGGTSGDILVGAGGIAPAGLPGGSVGADSASLVRGTPDRPAESSASSTPGLYPISPRHRPGGASAAALQPQKGHQRSQRHRNAPGQRSMDVYMDGQVRGEGIAPDQQALLPRSESVAGMYGSVGNGGSGKEWDAGSSHKGSHNSGRGGRRQKRRQGEGANVYPHCWEWRRPADEDVIIPSGAWIYLALIGWCTFGVAYVVNIVSSFLSIQVSGAFADLAVSLLGSGAKIYALALIRSCFLVSSFLAAWKLSPKFTSGSGIPEMKCVLSGVFMPAALSGWTLAAKIVGLILSLASSVSIGRLGPFIHISGICAALVSRIPWFPHLKSSARFQLQAVSCAMAAGVGATFGAPIGGAMLAIELMSTYYYIHWLPMALYCSIMGYYLSAAVTPVDAQAYFYASVSIGLTNQSLFKIITYATLGALCGVVGAALVQYTVFMYQVRSRFFTQRTLLRTSIFLAVFAAAHSLIVGEFGGVLEDGQRVAVIALFNEQSSPKQWIRHSAAPFDEETTWNSSFSLFTATVIKFLLTGISLILPVPAGTFMPIFEIGALLGRGFGELFMRFSFVTWIDPRATAIVAAAGVAAGTLHTTSIAVVMLEITREAVDILPLALGVIVSYGVSKHLCSDLFSELIKIRRLPFILGLRERYPKENRIFYERVASVSAKNFMSKEFPYVTPATTVGGIKQLLEGNGQGVTRWSTCAFLNNEKDRHLWGTISRPVLEKIVKEASIPFSRGRGATAGSASAAGSSTIHSPAPSSSHAQSSVGNSAVGQPSVGMPPLPRGPSSGSSHVELEGIVSSPEGELEAAERIQYEQAVRDAQPVPMLADFDPKIGHRMVDEGPMQVSSQTPFWKVATYFRMLGLSNMYVVHNGATLGHLTKIQVIDFTFDEEDRAAEDRREEIRQQRELAELTALARGAKLSGRGVSAAPLRGKRLATRFSQQDLVQMARQSIARKP